MLICSFIFVCNAHLNIFTWNLRDINVYYYYLLFYEGMNEQMNERRNERMNKRRNERMNEVVLQ